MPWLTLGLSGRSKILSHGLRMLEPGIVVGMKSVLISAVLKSRSERRIGVVVLAVVEKPGTSGRAR